MKREQAETEAKQIAETDGVVMVVCFNPYAEAPDEEDRFSYFPARALRVFQYEQEVTRFQPQGRGGPG